MLRLTLRTLLAYLDDTLEPLEIRPIGQKVAESDSAQELIARIKQVTRRRRLTTPPDSGPNQRFDANVVADYLDNELGDDEVAELEKLCLESDVHLAEIASCHQILTLVLGQPALVPPTARERMYGLVQGREAIASRRAVAPAPARTAAASADGDDLVLLGLPAAVRSHWARVLMPVAGVLLLVVLGSALYLALPRHDDPQIASAPTTSRAHDTNPDKPTDPGSGQEGTVPTGAPGDDKKKPEQGGAISTPQAEGNDRQKKNGSGDDVEDDPFMFRSGRPRRGRLSPKAPPSDERVAVGRYHGDSKTRPSLLVTSRGPEWRCVASGENVFTRDPLVSLPGYVSELRLNNDVDLLLCGHLPELSPPEVPQLRRLIDSAVILHASKDADLDLTLQRGRIIFTNRKDTGEAKVRLRFLDQLWTITLEEANTEVGVDLIHPNNRPDGDEEPDAHVLLWVRRGRAEVINDSGHRLSLKAPPGDALLSWQSWTSEQMPPISVPKPLSVWSPEVFVPTSTATEKFVRDVRVALKEVAARMGSDRAKSPVVSLQEASQDNEPRARGGRLVAIYAYASLDQPRELLEALSNTAADGSYERVAAAAALRAWLNQDPSHPRRLYDRKAKQGVLAGARYNNNDAQAIFTLLHDFPGDELGNPKALEGLADYLASDQVAIAELAWERLIDIGGSVLAANKVYFNAADPADQRQPAVEIVRKLIQAGKLPPRQRRAGPEPGPEEPEDRPAPRRKPTP